MTHETERSFGLVDVPGDDSSRSIETKWYMERAWKRGTEAQRTHDMRAFLEWLYTLEGLGTLVGTPAGEFRLEMRDLGITEATDAG